MRAEFKIKFKIIKTRVNARLSFKYLYGNGLANISKGMMNMKKLCGQLVMAPVTKGMTNIEKQN